MKTPLISLTIAGKNNQTVLSKRSHKIRRIYHFIQADKFSNCTFSVSVTYPNQSTNEGTYQTKENLIHAIKAFTEK